VSLGLTTANIQAEKFSIVVFECFVSKQWVIVWCKILAESW